MWTNYSWCWIYSLTLGKSSAVMLKPQRGRNIWNGKTERIKDSCLGVKRTFNFIWRDLKCVKCHFKNILLCGEFICCFDVTIQTLLFKILENTFWRVLSLLTVINWVHPPVNPLTKVGWETLDSFLINI